MSQVPPPPPPSPPPPPPSLQYLPKELLSHIVNLIDDVPSLKSCSLTCRALVPHSHALLFQRIAMNLSPLSPLTIEHPILPFVRTFVINPVYIMDFVPMADDALANILQGLENLETLEIRHCFWEAFSPETQSALASTSLRLKCLVLEDMQFPHLDAFLSLITSHSSLRRLSLDVAIGEWNEDVAIMPALHQLEEADIKCPSRLAPPILNMFCGLRSLTATIPNAEDATSLVQIIVAAGKNLEQLHVSHVGHDFDDEFPENIPLGRTSVKLQFAETDDNARVVRWWAKELARNATSCVLQIIINRPFDGGGDLGDWSALDAHRTVVELIPQRTGITPHFDTRPWESAFRSRFRSVFVCESISVED